MGHMPFKLNYGYHSHDSLKDKYDICFKSSLVKGLAVKLRELINICHQNLLHAQDLQKQAYIKGVKPWSYVSSEKVWFNSKHIKTKKNQKLEAKFFGPF